MVPFSRCFLLAKFGFVGKNFSKRRGVGICWQNVGRLLAKKKHLRHLFFTLILHYFNVLYGMLASVGKCCQK